MKESLIIELHFPESLVILQRKEMGRKPPFEEIQLSEIPDEKFEDLRDAARFLGGQIAV